MRNISTIAFAEVVAKLYSLIIVVISDLITSKVGQWVLSVF